jgi:TonB family protein
VGNTIRPRPPILTVSDKGQLFLENRVVTLDQLEEHLRFELLWRKQDTLLIRGDKAGLRPPLAPDKLKSVDVMAIAKRAGAKQIGILASDGASLAPATSTPVATPAAPGRDMAAAMNVVKANTGDVKGCYEQALRRGLIATSGRAEIRLGIDAEGRVSREEVVFHEIGDEAFKACLIEKMRVWRFPKSSSPSEVAFPVVFQGSEAGRPSPLPSGLASKILPASPPSSGEMDPAIVAKKIRDRMPDVRRCYEAALVRAPKLSGRVELKFTIDADGRVSRPSLAISTLNDAQVENCLIELSRSWTFPPPEGGPVEVSFPFEFSSGGADNK